MAGTTWLTSSCGDVTLLTTVLGCLAVEQMADEAAGVLHPDAVQKLKEAAPAPPGLYHLPQQAQDPTHAGGRARHQPGEPPQVRSRCLPQNAGDGHCGGALHVLARHMTGCACPAAALSAVLLLLLLQQILSLIWMALGVLLSAITPCAYCTFWLDRRPTHVRNMHVQCT